MLLLYLLLSPFVPGPDTPTCRSCTGEICDDNILPEVLQKGLLTSGYFSINIFSPEKPAGNLYLSSTFV